MLPERSFHVATVTPAPKEASSAASNHTSKPLALVKKDGGPLGSGSVSPSELVPSCVEASGTDTDTESVFEDQEPPPDDADGSGGGESSTPELGAGVA